MRLEDEATVLTLAPHGEHGAVVRFLGAAHGLRPGYVPGARSRRRRADLVPGTRVRVRFSARTEDALPTAAVEVLASRALLAFAPATAALLYYATRIVAARLAEADPHPRLAAALELLLDRCAAGAPLAPALARFELTLLAELGFGLDLGACALSGATTGLAFVSPRTGRAVSAAAVAGAPWAHRLLPLPAFLVDPNAPVTDAGDALALTGHFIGRNLVADRPDLAEARALAVLAAAPGCALSPAP